MTIVKGMTEIDSYMTALTALCPLVPVSYIGVFVICNDLWCWEWWQTALAEFGLTLILSLLCWLLWLIN